MIFFSNTVISFGGVELILEGAEGDWIAIYSDLCPIDIAFRAEGYSFVAGAVCSVTSFGAVA